MNPCKYINRKPGILLFVCPTQALIENLTRENSFIFSHFYIKTETECCSQMVCLVYSDVTFSLSLFFFLNTKFPLRGFQDNNSQLGHDSCSGLSSLCCLYPAPPVYAIIQTSFNTV